ncbi:MAG: hypothetical protein AAFX99_32690 [Myxococcota bacterium]
MTTARRKARWGWRICTAAATFAVGVGVGAVGTMPHEGSPLSNDPIAFVRPGSLMPEQQQSGEAWAPKRASSRTDRARAVATLVGEQRAGLRRLFAGRQTFSSPLAGGYEVVVDVYWELGHHQRDGEFTPAVRRPWFTEVSGMIYDTALEVARRDDGAITREEWPGGFIVPIRVRGYGLLLARFCWHTRSGQTGELFSRPSPALELLKPVDEGQVQRALEAYDTLVR